MSKGSCIFQLIICLFWTIFAALKIQDGTEAMAWWIIIISINSALMGSYFTRLAELFNTK